MHLYYSAHQTINPRSTWLETKLGINYLKIFGLALAYFVTAKLGFSLAFTADQVTSIWPPTGIALAVILIFGYRVWPGILLGAFAANYSLNEPFFTALGIAATNTLTALVGGYLLKEKLDFGGLNRIRDVLCLVFIGGVASTLISSTFGVLNLYGSQLLELENFFRVWLVWWVGDFMGVLLVTPLILVLASSEQMQRIKENRWQYFGFFGLLLLASGFVFYNPLTARASPSAYIVFPFIIWSALKLGQAGTATTNFLVALIAVLGTVTFRGPFILMVETETNLISLLMYIFIVAVTGLILTAVVAEKQAFVQKLKHQTYHDPLTGLNNRLFFNDHIEVAVEESKKANLSFAIIKVDIDRFATVVDSLGYDTADNLLKEVALRLRAIPDRNEILARSGSNEFAMTAKEIEGRDGAIILCQKIMDCFKEPFLLDGNEIYITMSVGVSTFPSDGTNTTLLLRNAAAALRQAKTLGGNNYQFYISTLNASAYGQLTLENSLRKGLENAEFELYYQPEIDLRTGKVIKNEALLRWNRPGIGVVAASEFIQLAEVTGIIEEIESQSLGVAIAQTARWHQEGQRVGVAVNLSARQFRNDHLVKYIEDNLKKSGLSPRFLDLEVTERILLEDFERVREILGKLKKMGITISIDDFNTGYSSMNYIKQFPFDVLKIDRSFVSGIPGNAHDCEIAKSVIQLAHNLNKQVTAEGIESERQKEFLFKHDCDNAQGYLFSPPLTAADCLAFLKSRAAVPA